MLELLCGSMLVEESAKLVTTCSHQIRGLLESPDFLSEYIRHGLMNDRHIKIVVC